MIRTECGSSLGGTLSSRGSRSSTKMNSSNSTNVAVGIIQVLLPTSGRCCSIQQRLWSASPHRRRRHHQHHQQQHQPCPSIFLLISWIKYAFVCHASDATVSAACRHNMFLSSRGSLTRHRLATCEFSHSGICFSRLSAARAGLQSGFGLIDEPPPCPLPPPLQPDPKPSAHKSYTNPALNHKP